MSGKKRVKVKAKAETPIVVRVRRDIGASFGDVCTGDKQPRRIESHGR